MTTMALRTLGLKTGGNISSIFRICPAFLHNSALDNESLLKEIQKNRNQEDLPIKTMNPFEKPKPKCILCELDIDPNYKNVRLLSQFVSSFTGKVYGRHITGLCAYKQKRVEAEIRLAQRAALMGFHVKNLNYHNDPDLYDPGQPYRYL